MRRDYFAGQAPGVLGPPDADLVRFLSAKLAPASRVLDCGCGQGRDALWLARAGHRVLGLEISATALGQLAALAAAEALPIRLRLGPLERFETAERFDLVLADRVLHRIADPAAALGRLAGCVTPGGLLVVVDGSGRLPVLRAALPADWPAAGRLPRGVAFRRPASPPGARRG